MTPFEIKRAIAKECDYYLVTPPEEDGTAAFSLREPKGTTRYPWHGTEEEAWADAPDFPEDLNAIREAEKTLSPVGETVVYVCKLIDILAQWKGKTPWSVPESAVGKQAVFSVRHATALQCAEAFLKVKGKWKE